MHSLIFGLLQKMMNPTVVSFKTPQALQVSNHASDHTWNPSYCLKKDDSVQPFSLLHFLGVVSSDYVKGSTHKFYQFQCEFILPGLRLMVVFLYSFNVFQVVDSMRHSVAEWIHYHPKLG